MSSYKEPSFQERTALANRARKAALEQLREKPQADEAELLKRRETALAREAAQAELEKAQKRERAEQSAAADAHAISKTDEERKMERDAKYAARKGRKGKK
jgi:Family of unknown function (DUF6481)